MPDTQIHPLGTVTAPGDFTIPGSAELKLKGVYASFDGSGAATSFIPLVRFISDAGSVALEAVADTTIAAGGSADASWFPRLAAAAAAAPSTSGLPWMFVSRAPSANLASSNAYSEIDLNPALGSVSTGQSADGSITLANVGDGTYGPCFTANGLYVILMQIEMRLASAPGAGTGAVSRFTGSSYYPVENPNTVPFTADPKGTGQYVADTTIGAVVNVDPFSQSPPQTLSLQALQDSTKTTSTVIVNLLAYQVNPKGSGNF